MNNDVAFLEAMAVSVEQYPDELLPEFAFAGRSNVGKSSFINAMAMRKKLAYTSSKPGKTRTVNFYRVDEMRLVDLPGYGYAAVSKKEKEAWAPIINTYLEKRESLLEVFLLVDMRHAPTSLDKEMYRWMLLNDFSGLIVATKSDKLSKNQQKKQLSLIAKEFDLPSTEQIIPFSSVKKDMVEDMWWILKDIVKHYE